MVRHPPPLNFYCCTRAPCFPSLSFGLKLLRTFSVTLLWKRKVLNMFKLYYQSFVLVWSLILVYSHLLTCTLKGFEHVELSSTLSRYTQSKRFEPVTTLGDSSLTSVLLVTEREFKPLRALHPLESSLIMCLILLLRICASRDTRIPYGWCRLIQGYFCAV